MGITTCTSARTSVLPRTNGDRRNVHACIFTAGTNSYTNCPSTSGSLAVAVDGVYDYNKMSITGSYAGVRDYLQLDLGAR